MVAPLAAAAAGVTVLQALTLKHSTAFEEVNAEEPPGLSRLTPSAHSTLTRLMLRSSAFVELPLLAPLSALSRLRDLNLALYQSGCIQ